MIDQNPIFIFRNLKPKGNFIKYQIKIIIKIINKLNKNLTHKMI